MSRVFIEDETLCTYMKHCRNWLTQGALTNHYYKQKQVMFCSSGKHVYQTYH
uniref:Uncharacterized protein n=1 Tax=Rhizophora mucronata TaxID=61149 RepID=A0A2P2QX78_RHIMU